MAFEYAFPHFTITAARRHRMVVPAACAFIAALALASPVMAGCNSGNVGTPDLLTSTNCQATANGADSTAVGISAFGDFGGTAFGFDSTASGAFSCSGLPVTQASATDV